jgi:hypothetical protein
VSAEQLDELCDSHIGVSITTGYATDGLAKVRDIDDCEGSCLCGFGL